MKMHQIQYELIGDFGNVASYLNNENIIQQVAGCSGSLLTIPTNGSVAGPKVVTTIPAARPRLKPRSLLPKPKHPTINLPQHNNATKSTCAEKLYDSYSQSSKLVENIKKGSIVHRPALKSISNSDSHSNANYMADYPGSKTYKVTDNENGSVLTQDFLTTHELLSPYHEQDAIPAKLSVPEAVTKRSIIPTKTYVNKNGKKRKVDVVNGSNEDVFNNLAAMVDDGVLINNKEMDNDEVSNFEILAEIRLNRKKLNMIHKLLKERINVNDEMPENFPVNFPISSTAELKDIERMIKDSDFQDKLKVHLTDKLKLSRQHSSQQRTKSVLEELFDDNIFDEISFAPPRKGEKKQKVHVSSFKFFTNFMKDLVCIKHFKDLRKMIVEYGDLARRKLKYRKTSDDQEPLLLNEQHE